MRLNNKGFTLVEVLAVVVILAVIAGIAVNGVLYSINKSKESSYNMMISNVVIASQTLYEEVDFDNDIYEYGLNGLTSNKLDISPSDNTIRTNLQSLVSNGFLSGTENPCKDDASCSNKNKRLIVNPKNGEDLGDCIILIKKQSNKYIVSSVDDNDSKCPDNYVKEVR